MAKEKGGRDIRTIIANPRDPIGGEDSFTFYNITRPQRGSARDIEAARRELRGLRGKKVRVTLIGERYDKDSSDVIAQTRNSTTVTLNRYSDIFGSSGALLELLKRQLERDSEDIYTVQYLEVEDIEA